MTAWACYDFKNVKSVSKDVVLNRPKFAAYRAPSAPIAAFAIESTMDECAKAIGMDPDRLPHQERAPRKHQVVPMARSMVRSASARRWKPPRSIRTGMPAGNPAWGRGMACGFWFNFGGQTCVDINVTPDGNVTVAVGTIDVGARARRWPWPSPRNWA